MSKSISKKEVSMSIGGVGGDKPIFGSFFGKATAKTGKMHAGKKVIAGGVFNSLIKSVHISAIPAENQELQKLVKIEIT